MDTRDAGKLGGEARARALTATQRREIARLGGLARGDALRRAKAKARKLGRIAAGSRKANR